MAKKRKRMKGLTAYFRNIFVERPDWLHQKSNNDVLARYRADHNLGADKELEPRIKSALANLKSIMRKEIRGGKGGVATAMAARPTGAAAHRMEMLEELIDDCLSTAKSLDSVGLHDVIRSLRSARNEVVWRLGQP